MGEKKKILNDYMSLGVYIHSIRMQQLLKIVSILCGMSLDLL